MPSHQRNPVEEDDAGIVAATGTVIAVVEDPFLPVLELNSCEAQSSGDLGNPGFDYNPASPGSEIFMEDSVPHSQVGMGLDGPLRGWPAFFLRDTGNRTDLLREPFHGFDSFQTFSIIPHPLKNLQPSEGQMLLYTLPPKAAPALHLAWVWKGLINQHHRDIVFDLVKEPTGFTDQAIPGLV
jgi:hypothetical protein